MVVRELQEKENEKWLEFVEKSLSKPVFIEEIQFDLCFKLVAEIHDKIVCGLCSEGKNKKVKLYVLPEYNEKDFERLLIGAAKYMDCK